MNGKKIFLVLTVLFLSTLACNLPGQSGDIEEPPVGVTEPPIAMTEEVQPPAESQASLQIDPVQYASGDQIIVSFTAPAGLSPDAWVGILPSNIAHGSEEENDQYDLAYEYLDGRTQGIVTFNTPQEPGSYDIRMFDTDSSGQEIASVSFSVIAGQAAEPDVNCNGISFSYDGSLADQVVCEIIPENLDGTDGAYWDKYPEYDQIDFVGYAVQDSFHKPQLTVYPITDYENMNERAAEMISGLRQVLADRPTNPEYLPFLPIFNAAQMLQSNILYLDFANGSGIRFLTQYGQAAYPINNNGLFYTFQGITEDGLYYITAIFPVTHPDLPATGDTVPNNDWDAFYNTFDSYINDIEIDLSGKPNPSFSPNLDLLDQLIRNLQVD